MSFRGSFATLMNIRVILIYESRLVPGGALTERLSGGLEKITAAGFRKRFLF